MEELHHWLGLLNHDPIHQLCKDFYFNSYTLFSSPLLSLYCSCKLTGRSCIFEFLKSHHFFKRDCTEPRPAEIWSSPKPLPPQANFSPLLLTGENVILCLVGIPLPSNWGSCSSCCCSQAPRGIWHQFLAGCNYIPAAHYLLPTHTAPPGLELSTPLLLQPHKQPGVTSDPSAALQLNG